MTTASFTTTFGATSNDITATLTGMVMNGQDGLRALARSLDIGVKGVSKADLVDQLAAIIGTKVQEEQAALAATVEQAPRTRNDNHTILASEDIVEPLWALLTREGGALVNDIHALFTAHGINVARGTVVSRLATQRNNGMVVSRNDVDEQNRTITFFSATAAWDKDTMARKFAKVK